LNFITSGPRSVRVTVKDAQGAILFTTLRKISVADPVERYLLVKSVFDGTLGWLKAADLDTAVAVISPLIRDQYRQIRNLANRRNVRF